MSDDPFRRAVQRVSYAASLEHQLAQQRIRAERAEAALNDALAEMNAALAELAAARALIAALRDGPMLGEQTALLREFDRKMSGS